MHWRGYGQGSTRQMSSTETVKIDFIMLNWLERFKAKSMGNVSAKYLNEINSYPKVEN